MLVAQLEIPSRIERIIRSADIPDYDKIVQRDNPLDSVVKKFESKGYTPE